MEKIFVGKIVGTFGVKGELKVVTSFEAPEKVFVTGKKVLLGDEEHTISGVKFHKGNYIIELDNIKDINKVEDFRKKNIFKRKALFTKIYWNNINLYWYSYFIFY